MAHSAVWSKEKRLSGFGKPFSLVGTAIFELATPRTPIKRDAKT